MSLEGLIVRTAVPSYVGPCPGPRCFRPARCSHPRGWRTEVLAGLVVALALVPEARRYG
ncbi:MULTISPECIES: hypothetical protein [unclassified Streptomyces]|uniref:hypothetical protein n=1 Tax=unclassified Streptomyces TaxID=2593676 RepID=UPI00131B5665|nr:hypothetical protein [Streptomyces sp. NRRL F-5630]